MMEVKLRDNNVEVININYVCSSPTLQRFERSTADNQLILGPVGCLAGESRIWTENGLQTMDELYRRGKPFRVYSLHKDGRWSLEWATAPFCKGCEPLLRVDVTDVTGDAGFRGAASHLVQLNDDTWRTIRDLKAGDLLKQWARVSRKVTRIVSTQPDFYYDLTVEATGNYIGEWGVIHHNSGKTVVLCNKLFRMAMMMPPCKDGVRRSRAVMIRDTSTNLSDTTMVTWLKSFPEDPDKTLAKGYTKITRVNWSAPMEMQILLPMPDGTKMDLLIYCRHQACAADKENLKSLELSFALVNETNNVPKECIDMLISRIGRFPDKKDFLVHPDSKEALEIDPFTGRNKVPFFCAMYDANMPPDDHWIHDLAEVKTPKEWEVFKQPPALLRKKFPDGKIYYTENKGQRIAQGILPAENIDNLTEGWKYYTKQISNKTHEWISVFLMAEYGTFTEGQPVYPDFNDSVNYVNEEIPFDKSKTLFLGFDWGLWPSAAFGQMSDHGQLQLIDEVDGEGVKMGIEQLWEQKLGPHLVNRYGWLSGTQIFAVGDPATGVSQVDMSNCISYLGKQGLHVVPCLTNDPSVRIGAVQYFLHRVADKGKAGLVVCKLAPKIKKGFNGGYFLKQMTQHKDKVYSGEPCKNSFSHLADAVEYMCHAIKNPDLYNIEWRNKNLFVGDISAKTQPSNLPSLDMSGFI